MELGAEERAIGAPTPKLGVACDHSVCVYFDDTGIKSGTRSNGRRGNTKAAPSLTNPKKQRIV